MHSFRVLHCTVPGVFSCAYSLSSRRWFNQLEEGVMHVQCAAVVQLPEHLTGLRYFVVVGCHRGPLAASL